MHKATFSTPSLPPSLPSKDSRYMTDELNQPQLQQPAFKSSPENPIVDESLI